MKKNWFEANERKRSERKENETKRKGNECAQEGNYHSHALAEISLPGRRRKVAENLDLARREKLEQCDRENRLGLIATRNQMTSLYR